MNDDVRIAALRAASKLALGVTFLAGCSGAVTDPSVPSEGDEAASEDYITGGGRGARNGGTVASFGKPCQDAGKADATDGAAPKPACEALLASTFASPAWDDLRDYRWETAPVPAVSADVASCCRAEFGDAGFHAPDEYRWECCNLLGGGMSTGEGAPMGCTPWGPPVPPAMRPALGVA